MVLRGCFANQFSSLLRPLMPPVPTQIPPSHTTPLVSSLPILPPPLHPSVLLTFLSRPLAISVWPRDK